MRFSTSAFRGRASALVTRILRPLGLVWTLVFVALSFGSVYPIWRAKHPPIQDLPQHLAAISVLKNYPELNLGQYFDLQLAKTQYLTYYLLAQALSYLAGVTLANKILLCASLIALPWSIASLLRELGRDTRLAVFAFGLTYNAHLILGFFNFLAALPLVFWGLTAAVRLRNEHTTKRMVYLGLWLLVCFYMHVVPFAFLGLGATVVLIGDSLKLTVQRGFAFIPALIAAGGWLASTPAGRATLAAADAAETVEKPVYVTIGQAIRELPTWLTDVLHRERDDQLLVAWGALLLLAMAVGLKPKARPKPRTSGVAIGAPPEVPDGSARSWLKRNLWPHVPPEDENDPNYAWLLGLMSPLAFVAYFVLPSAYDWIWPISGRFPLLALLFLTLLLPRLRGWLGGTVLLAAAIVASLSFYEVNRSFVQFEREEVGDIDQALAAIPRGERVAGLIFGGSSNIVRFAPFLHYVALYQARKGGVVMFTFAEFPQSPFRFKQSTRPPIVPPRWEWTPERVDPDRDLTWYRYVLVRGGPGRIQRSPYFESVFQGAGWTVWRRVDT